MGRFERDGYAITDLVIASSACERIAEELPEADARRGGVRGLLDSPTVLRIVQAPQFSRAIFEYVDRPLVAIKATLFDKTPASNWRVQWHQDRTLKNGAMKLEPPASALESMLAVRIHLDDCGADNGPLRIIPGSHRAGLLNEDEIAQRVMNGPQTTLALPQGATLLMRPLLLHASSPATSATHRRVLHIELVPPDVVKEWGWPQAVALS